VKVHSFDQYSEDWWRVRSGLPSASCADKLLTPTGKPSAQAKAYIASLLADELGYRDEDVSTAWMERGLEMEEEAIAMLELQQDLDTQACGLITNDDVTACCSPDAVVCVAGEIVAGVEVKSPMAKTHIQYLLEDKLPGKYRLQVHFSMAVSGLDRWWFVSYFPELRPLIVCVERDHFTDQVLSALEDFNEMLERARKII
jgi:hypothetical protein